MTNQFLYKRRLFIMGLGGGVLAPTLLPRFTAQAQQQHTLPVVGLLSLATSFGGGLEAFRQARTSGRGT